VGSEPIKPLMLNIEVAGDSSGDSQSTVAKALILLYEVHVQVMLSWESITPLGSPVVPLV
jgi:hypothetical protein